MSKGRAKLYKIPESLIADILSGMDLDRGEHEIITGVAGAQYPLKIVVSAAGDTGTVTASYPLKKGKK